MHKFYEIALLLLTQVRQSTQPSSCGSVLLTSSTWACVCCSLRLLEVLGGAGGPPPGAPSGPGAPGAPGGPAGGAASGADLENKSTGRMRFLS